MNYRELLMKGAEQLSEAGVEEARNDAQLLLFSAFQIDRSRYFLDQLCEQEFPKERLDCYWNWIGQRAERIPLQHILGTQEFCGLEFEVNESVLIPRQDTELLVEAVLALEGTNQTILDLCTGSGCIAISLEQLGKFRHVDAVDLSDPALEVAKRNGVRLHSAVHFFQSDLFAQVTEAYDVIVSNPPYIADSVIETLQPEVRDHEPYLALSGREDGLFFYRRISEQAGSYLKPHGWLLYEIGYDQGADVSAILQECGFENIEVKKDFAGLDRVVKARKG